MPDWPLVGRDEEVRRVRSAFAGSRAGVVLIGDIGVGKTKLARELLASFTADGLSTSWTAATEAMRSIPFGAILHLLPSDWPPDGTPSQSGAVAQGGGAVAQGGSPQESLPTDGDRLAVLATSTARIRELGGRGRVILGFDDAHLLDEGSAALVGHLAAQRLAFLVVTVRSGTEVPDAITALWKDGMAERLDLAPLPEHAVDALVDHALGADVEGLTRNMLHRSAAGNPLALRELLSHGVATGTLREVYGVWRITGSGRPAGSLRQLVESRLRLPATGTRRVLDVLACAEPLPLALAEALAGSDAIDAAEVDGVVAVERDGARSRVLLAHPLYGEVLRAAMPASRARRIRQELARVALTGPLRRRGDALRVGLWLVDSGEVTRPDVARAGAREAIDRSDLALAERLARSARQADPGPESDRLLAQILEYRGCSAEAAEMLPAQPPLGASLAQWAVTRAETLYWGFGDVTAAERALDLAATDPEGADVAEASRSWILLFDGRCAAALAIARQLLASDSAHPQATIWAAAAGVAAAGFLGLREEADDLHRRGRAAATVHQGSLPWGVAQVGYGRCLAHLACGELTTAQAVAHDGYGRAVDEGAPLMAAGWAGFRGLVATAAGAPDSAGRSLRESVAALTDNDSFRLVRCFLGGLAMASALAGDSVAAQAWLARADQRATAANRLFAPWLELWRAWTVAANGGNGEAATAARAAADLARDTGLPTVEAQARYDAVRLGARGEWQRLVELDAELRIPLTRALAAAAEGLERMDGDTLSEAAGAFAALGHHLLAAEAATTAGTAYRQAGQRSSAALALENAAMLRVSCVGASTPLLASDGIAGLLTPREREVAHLAARYSTREIAERLGLSPATVNNNLSRVYAKLGINGRAQLAALLGS